MKPSNYTLIMAAASGMIMIAASISISSGSADTVIAALSDKDYDKALFEMEAVHGERLDDIKFMKEFIDLQLARGHVDRVQALLNEVIASAERPRWAYEEKVAIADKIGSLDDRVKALDALFRHAPDATTFRRLLEVREMKQDRAGLMAFMAREGSLPLLDAEDYERLAHHEAMTGDFDKARSYFESAIALEHSAEERTLKRLDLFAMIAATKGVGEAIKQIVSLGVDMDDPALRERFVHAEELMHRRNENDDIVQADGSQSVVFVEDRTSGQLRPVTIIRGKPGAGERLAEATEESRRQPSARIERLRPQGM